MEGSVTAALLEEYSMSRSEAVRNEIVLKNLGLVRSCALSLRNTYIKYGEVGDVVNEGVIALMDAIETYDPSRGCKVRDLRFAEDTRRDYRLCSETGLGSKTCKKICPRP